MLHEVLVLSLCHQEDMSLMTRYVELDRRHTHSVTSQINLIWTRSIPSFLSRIEDITTSEQRLPSPASAVSKVSFSLLLSDHRLVVQAGVFEGFCRMNC